MRGSRSACFVENVRTLQTLRLVSRSTAPKEVSVEHYGRRPEVQLDHFITGKDQGKIFCPHVRCDVSGWVRCGVPLSHFGIYWMVSGEPGDNIVRSLRFSCWNVHI